VSEDNWVDPSLAEDYMSALIAEVNKSRNEQHTIDTGRVEIVKSLADALADEISKLTTFELTAVTKSDCFAAVMLAHSELHRRFEEATNVLYIGND
jgi:hypothetical protein